MKVIIFFMIRYNELINFLIILLMYKLIVFSFFEIVVLVKYIICIIIVLFLVVYKILDIYL